MKLILWIFSATTLVLALNSCGTSGSNGGGGTGVQQAGTGPFDSRGNYVEEWADNPSKWRKPGSYTPANPTKKESLSQLTQTDQPPLNSVPLVTSKPAAAVQTIAASKVISKPADVQPARPIVTKTASRPESDSDIERPKPKPTREIERPKTKPKVKVTSRSESKIKAKPKAKVKPKSTRYTVRRGDSLSMIANRTGASVSSIKRENGISGSVIRPGQSLTIPK